MFLSIVDICLSFALAVSGSVQGLVNSWSKSGPSWWGMGPLASWYSRLAKENESGSNPKLRWIITHQSEPWWCGKVGSIDCPFWQRGYCLRPKGWRIQLQCISIWRVTWRPSGLQGFSPLGLLNAVLFNAGNDEGLKLRQTACIMKQGRRSSHCKDSQLWVDIQHSKCDWSHPFLDTPRDWWSSLKNCDDSDSSQGSFCQGDWGEIWTCHIGNMSKR